MTRTIRRRFPVLFAAVALLALFGALALPATTQAQSAGVLVSNIGEDQEGVGHAMNDNRLLAQSFSVPSGGGNYTLTSIEMLIGRDISSTNIGSLGVSVWSADASFNPDSSLHTLTNPASVAEDVAASFTAPAGATLEAGNTYFVVAYNDRDISGGPSWEGTNSDDQDATSITGWTIANNGLRRAPADTSWSGRTYAFTLRVNGTAVGGGTPSSDATLSALTVTAGGTDLVTFASDTETYTAMVANDVAEVTVTATQNDSGASIDYLDGDDATLDDADTGVDGHQVTLAEGDNVIKVKVTAADSSTKTYTVTVTQAAAASTCTLNTGDLWCGVVTVGTSSDGVGFVAAETETDTDVGALTDNNGDQTITIESDTYTISSVLILTSGAVGALVITLDTKFPTSDVATLEFDIGSKTFKVSEASVLLVGDGYYWLDSGLTWSDGDTDVTLRLRRAATLSMDATLSALTVTGGGSDLVTFASGTKTYTAMVASDVAEVTVTAETTDSGATVAYLDGDDATTTDADTGVDGHQVTLAVGDNVIKVKVTAEDTNATETYTVTVTRAEAPTCTLNTGDLWCGVVTVGTLELFGTPVGYGFVSADGTGALSDAGFSVGTNDYPFDRVWTGVDSTAGNLGVSLTSALTATDKAKLVLHVDGSSDTLAFSVQTPDSDHTYVWESTGLDWSSESEVTLRVREAATPPDAPTNFTATVGDTQVTLAWKAVALDSGVMGHEFRYKTDGDYEETWTAIADSGPDETNEDSFTVTGLTNEEAHTFELRAVNTAGGGDAAEAGPVTPTPGICDRTQKIQEVILAELADVDDCAAVTVANLASITTLGFLGLSTSNQGISSLKKGDFAGLTALTVLNLRMNSLTSLPEGIFADLTDLTELDLSSNELESLPEGAFDGLVKLVLLNLGANSLAEVQAGAFDDLTALVILSMSSNDLSSLHDEVFSGPTALTTLNLSGNTTLSSLPAGVFSGLTALTDLHLNDNDLSSLHEDVFSGLTVLNNLYLDNNNLPSLDAGVFSGLTSLTRLELNNNNLDSLPEGLFTGLTALSILTLEGNNTDPLQLTVTVEKVGTDQVRAKVLAGAPFAVDIPVTLVNGTLTGSVMELSVAAGEVYSEPVTMTRTAGTTAAATVDVDLTTQPTLPTLHMGYTFVKATVNLPATILPDATNAAPAFTSSTTFNPAENQTAVGMVEADDSDTTDEITGYALNGGADQALFSINNSGVLTFQAVPNYEDPQDANTDNAYVVVVRATSGTGARVKTTDQTITVTVMDVDEQPDRPDKPTVTAVSGSSTSLDVSWTEPGLNGGPAITGYQLRYRSRASAPDPWSPAVDWPHTGTTTTTTITGLTATTEYLVQVKALNGETPGVYSPGSDVVSTNAAVDSVLGFSETAPRRAVPENSAAGVAVGAPVTATPADSGDTLEYTLEGTDASSFDIVRTSGQIRTISGVTYDYEEQSSYAVTVKASDGTASVTVDVTINLRDVDEQPDKPAKPTLAAVSGSATRLDASWTEPGRNGGPAITGYEVQYREGTSGNWVNVTHSGAGVTRTITGLRGNTEHQVRVRALNGETPSAWSDPSDAVRTNAATDAPTVASVAVKSAPQSGDAYGWGETIVFTLTFNQEVRVTGQPQPTLTFNLGRSTREARYSGITDTDVDSDPRPRPRPEGVKVHFHYTVQPGDVDSNGIHVGALASAIDLGGARIQSAADPRRRGRPQGGRRRRRPRPCRAGPAVRPPGGRRNGAAAGRFRDHDHRYLWQSADGQPADASREHPGALRLQAEHPADAHGVGVGDRVRRRPGSAGVADGQCHNGDHAGRVGDPVLHGTQGGDRRRRGDR